MQCLRGRVHSVCVFCFGVCIALVLLPGAAPSESDEAHETSFFLFSMFSIQLEPCAFFSGEQTEEAMLVLMFLPEVISSP